MVDPSGDRNFDATIFRDSLRQQKIAARLAMTAADHARASASIEQRLTTLLTARPPASIAFCWPLRKEFDCRRLVGDLLDAGWDACQPVVVAPAMPMVFRAWRPNSPMTTDRHGIPVPNTRTVAAPGIILLPLVAFDESGYRLGYGGGYFDRTLASLTPRPIGIGVGFELARIDTVRPTAYDIPLDVIVTETELRDISAAVSARVLDPGRPPTG
jgi:5,10-methenyltetrahydrofolate synthetase